jgi:hypothetical protein
MVGWTVRKRLPSAYLYVNMSRMEKTLRANMLVLATTYAKATDVSAQAIGQRIMRDNTFFRRIAEGAGFTASTYDRVVHWFDENWPDEVAWLAYIPRPSQSIRPRPGRNRKAAALG